MLFLLLAVLLFNAGSAYCTQSDKYGDYTNDRGGSGTSAYIQRGNTYTSTDPHNPTTYTQYGNRAYGSDGSSYTLYPGRTIQNNSTGQTYQIHNNLISPLR